MVLVGGRDYACTVARRGAEPLVLLLEVLVPVALADLLGAEGVLFDLDGVLTPTAEVHMRAWQAVFDGVFAAWNIEPPYTDADYYDYVDGKKRYDGVASLLRSRNVEIPWGAVDDEPEAETICGIGNRKNAAFAASLRSEGIAPYPGSLALIEKLRAAGVPLGVVSSSKNAEEVLAAAGIRSFFVAVVDGVVAERDGLPSKPAPEMFAAGAAALGVDPDLSVAVEDATSGVASAAAAGFATVIGVDRGAGAEALRAAGATVIVDDLDEFLSASAPDTASDSEETA
jgi:beta-phosphoglucomutase family hydrolase